MAISAARIRRDTMANSRAIKPSNVNHGVADTTIGANGSSCKSAGSARAAAPARARSANIVARKPSRRCRLCGFTADLDTGRAVALAERGLAAARARTLAPVVVLRAFAILPFLLARLSLPCFSCDLPLYRVRLVFRCLFAMRKSSSHQTGTKTGHALVPGSVRWLA